MASQAPPSYDVEGSAPLLPPQLPYPQQMGHPMYPPMVQAEGQAQVQYQFNPSDKQAQAYGVPPQPAVAYQPTTVMQPGQPYPPGANVVFVQAPQPPPNEQLHKMKDLLGLSIFTTICCNLLFGIIAIIYSIRVRDAKRHNDYREAKAAYKVMLAMNITGIVLSVVLEAIILILFFTGAMATRSVSTYSFGNS